MNKVLVLLFALALGSQGCKKLKMKRLDGTYAGTMNIHSSTYGPYSSGTSDTSYPATIAVSLVGQDSIKIDNETFLYTNDDKYVAGGIKYYFEAEFYARKKIRVKKVYGGGSGSGGSNSRYEFDGSQ